MMSLKGWRILKQHGTDYRVDRHGSGTDDDLRLFPSGNENGAEPVDRRSFLGLARHDDNGGVSLAHLWLLCRKPFRFCSERHNISVFAGAFVCQNSRFPQRKEGGVIRSQEEVGGEMLRLRPV
jgi:hypothetical protein